MSAVIELGRGLLPIALDLIMKYSIAGAAALVAVALLGRQRPRLAFAFVIAAFLAGTAALFIDPAPSSATGYRGSPFTLTLAERAVAAKGASPAERGADPLPAGEGLESSLQPASESPASPGGSLPDIPGLLGLLWLAGIALILAHRSACALIVRRELRRASAVTEPRLLEAAKELGLEAERLLVSPQAPVSYTARILGPRIVLPAEALRWSGERLRATLLHERAHIARSDNLLAGALHLAATLAWLSPLPWMAFFAAIKLREAACDEAVLRSGLSPKRYAADLLESARSLSSSRRVSQVAAMADSGGLERRIRAILDWAEARARPFPRARSASAALVLAAAAFMSAFVGTAYAAELGQGAAWEAGTDAKRGSFILSLSASIAKIKLDIGGKSFETSLPLDRVPSLIPLGKRSRLRTSFGEIVDPKTGKRSFSRGWDISEGPKMKVVAAAGGRVSLSRDEAAKGPVVEIDHGSNLRSRYEFGPTGLVTVTTGQELAAGEALGFLGPLGSIVLGEMPPLHFEILMDAGGESVSLDPSAFLFSAPDNKNAALASSVLNAAIRADHREQAKRLVALGIDLNVPAVDFTLPLEWTVLMQNAELARLLVAAGADPDAKTAEKLSEYIASSGPTIAEYAREIGNPAMIEALKRR